MSAGGVVAHWSNIRVNRQAACTELCGCRGVDGKVALVMFFILGISVSSRCTSLV